MKKIKNVFLSLGLSVPLILWWCAKNNKEVDFHLDTVSKSVSQVLTPEKVIVYNDSSKISWKNLEQKVIDLHISKTIDLDLDLNYKLKKNIASIWENEFKFFTVFFNLSNNRDILEKIKSIQVDNWLKQDEILWQETLSVIYLKYYSKIDKTKLPFDILKRLEIYKEMSDYRNHTKKWTEYWTVKPMSVPNVFDKDFYYWDSLWVNIPWTYINAELFSKVEKTIKKQWVVSKIIIVDWKFAITTYINQELRLLSYISPWSSGIKWWIKTELWKFNTTVEDMYHISSAKESVKMTKNWAIWPVMPYALHIVWWIYSHMWYVDWERRSHGCVRLPFLYAKGLYEIYKSTWNMSWEIASN